MWDTKLKVTSGQRRKTNEQEFTDTDNSMVLTRGRRGEREEKGKRVKYMGTEEDLTLGGGYTRRYTDDHRTVHLET